MLPLVTETDVAKLCHWAIPGFVKEIVEGLETQDALDALDAAGRLFWDKTSSHSFWPVRVGCGKGPQRPDEREPRP